MIGALIKNRPHYVGGKGLHLEIDWTETSGRVTGIIPRISPMYKTFYCA